jgi:hypothetical protein
MLLCLVAVAVAVEILQLVMVAVAVAVAVFSKVGYLQKLPCHALSVRAVLLELLVALEVDKAEQHHLVVILQAVAVVAVHLAAVLLLAKAVL